MSATSKLNPTVDHYARLAPLGVMILHYTIFRPVLTCQKATFAELEQTARQFFMLPANAQLKFFTTFVTDDLLQIDPDAWPRIYQVVTALWIEIDLAPPQKDLAIDTVLAGIMSGMIQSSAPSPGPKPTQPTATPSTGTKFSDANQIFVPGSGPTPPQSRATPSADATSSSGSTTSTATPSPGANSSGANKTSASGSGPASVQPTATPNAGTAFFSPAAPTTSAPAFVFKSTQPVFSFSSDHPAFNFSRPPNPLPSKPSPFSFDTSSNSPSRFAKPVIYLYPPSPGSVNVRLSLISPWEFSAIYPLATAKHLESGPLVGRESITWDVVASPDGQLRLSDGLQVSYLYWEAETRSPGGVDTPPSSRPLTPEWALSVERFDPSNPILTPQDSVLLRVPGDVTKYLDKALLALGLHTEARTSFITYWLPSFVKHEYIALRFVEQSSYEAAARLDITPKPDVVMRVFMLFRGVDGQSVADWSAAAERAQDMDVAKWKTIVGVDVEKMSCEELFRVLEWGGMEVYQ
ncbi:hypothetical protein APHAL10511_005486 [Amanita phalloides]|nr:hypothetical protein APHAL10511_005486 [Amanita phalloides]